MIKQSRSARNLVSGLRSVGLCFWLVVGVNAVAFLIISKTSQKRLEIWFELPVSSVQDGENLAKLVSAWSTEYGMRFDKCHSKVIQNQTNLQRQVCFISSYNLDETYHNLADLFGEVRDAGILLKTYGAKETGVRHTPPLWALFVAIGLFILPSVALNRDQLTSRELRKSLRTLLRRPWLALVLPVVCLLIANITTAILQDYSSGGENGSAILTMESAGEELKAAIYLLISSPVSWLFLVIVTPFFEESMFRGWLYRRLESELPRFLALGVNSWFFMLAHGLIPLIALATGLAMLPVKSLPILLPITFSIGAFLYLIRERYRSLWLCVLLHTFYNLLVMLSFLALYLLMSD